MKKFVIVTETTTDISDKMAKDLGIKMIPMNLELEGKSYTHYSDEREISIETFYDVLRKGGNSVTSLVNTDTFLSYFRPILEEGNDILYISFSSGLSGTYNASLIARDELLEEYPDAKIICVDTKAASAGEGLMVYSAVKKKEEGLTIDELELWIENNALRLCQWFTVDDLNHLKRGGRVSAFSATIGTALNIKPILHVDNEGHLIPMEKVRGRKKSLIALFEHMEETVVNPKEQVVFISHGDALEDAEFLGNMIKEKLQVKEVVISKIGPVIGTHSGPGTIALFFFGTNR